MHRLVMDCVGVFNFKMELAKSASSQALFILAWKNGEPKHETSLLANGSLQKTSQKRQLCVAFGLHLT